MSSTWKNNIEITIFGESHGKAIGIVLGNLPAGIKIDMDEVAREMKRRAPGQNKMSTPRKEADKVEVVSGLYEGITTGAPLCGMIYNCDQHSKDYSLLKEKMRPGHSDYPAFVKYQGFNDVRGGGHFSGRITAPIVFTGAIAKQILAKQGIHVGAHILSIKDIYDEYFDMRLSNETLNYLSEQQYPVLNKDIYSIPSACEKELDEIETALNTEMEVENLSKEQFSFLNYCAAAGIPRAARILGEMYLQGKGTVEDIGKAGEYLRYAVRAGDIKAMSLLGDYCYEKGYYNEAYKLFTSPGTFAVDSSKRQIVSNLCDIKVFNRKELVAWFAVTAALETLILFLPASPITGGHIIAKVICSLLNVGVFGLLTLNWYKQPYSDLRQYGPLYVLTVFIFLFIYIV